MKRASDPCKYYAILGVEPSSSPKDIKRGWRQAVKKYHPDRDSSKEAALSFQKIQEAWRVLSDPINRVEYDATGIPPLRRDGDDVPPVPLNCSVCGVISAQPRYVKYPWVQSFLFWGQRGEIEGVFCRACGDNAAAKASTISWIHGLWSLPGLLWTPMALWRNLMGGIKPAEDNARLLIRQARAFLAWDEVEVARNLVKQASHYATSLVHLRQIQTLRERMSDPPQIRRQGIDGWRPWRSKSFLAQLLPIIALPLLIVFFAVGLSRPWEEIIATRDTITVVPPQKGEQRHVALDNIKLRELPMESAAVLRVLDRFTPVDIFQSSKDGQWVQVQVAGLMADEKEDPINKGWLPTRVLYVGSGEKEKLAWCQEEKRQTPDPGDILIRRAVGQHRAQFHNKTGQDAVVKLKSSTGSTMVSIYIPTAYSVILTGIPNGTWRIEYASGEDYSKVCRRFLKEEQAWLLPYQVNLRPMTILQRESLNVLIPEITLLTRDSANKAYRPLDIRRFRKND